MDWSAKHADSLEYYNLMLDVACVNGRLGYLDKAIEMGNSVVDAHLRRKDTLSAAQGYVSLAAFYGEAGMPEESKNAMQRGFDIQKVQSDPILQSQAYNQMAFTYIDMLQWEQALLYLDTARIRLQFSKKQDFMPIILMNMGNCLYYLGHYEPATAILDSATHLARSLGQLHIESEALHCLSDIAESRGRFDEALANFKEYTAIEDSIFSKEKMEGLAQMEAMRHITEKERENELLKARQQTEVTRRNIALMLWVLTMLAIDLWVYFRKEKARRLQKELTENREQLEEFTQLLLAKNTRLIKLEQSSGREPEPADPENGEDDSDTLSTGILYGVHILTEADWMSFKRTFERTYPGFILRLRTAYPDLSNAEERLFLLYKLNFTRHEIATILGVSETSVKKGRTRLRKRLGLSEDKGLEHFTQTF